MCPTLGKQVLRSDNKVFSIFKSKTYYRDIKTLTYGVFMLYIVLMFMHVSDTLKKVRHFFLVCKSCLNGKMWPTLGH